VHNDSRDYVNKNQGKLATAPNINNNLNNKINSNKLNNQSKEEEKLNNKNTINNNINNKPKNKQFNEKSFKPDLILPLDSNSDKFKNNSNKANAKLIENKSNKPSEMKTTKNNQSSFAKNPTHSYAELYYQSFPPGYKPNKLPYYYENYYKYPYGMPPAPLPLGYVPPPPPPPYAYPYHRYDQKFNKKPYNTTYLPAISNNSNKYKNNYWPHNSPAGILPYNYWARPPYPVVDKKDPSIHDLLYYDTFRVKDGN
jgi:hypothetical protein